MPACPVIPRVGGGKGSAPVRGGFLIDALLCVFGALEACGMESAAQPPSDQDATVAGVSRPAAGRKWLLLGAVMVLCGIPFLQSYDRRDRPVSLDEIYWIGQAYYYHLAIEQMEWAHPDWRLLPARENPPLGKYVIGLGLQLNGLSVTNVDWLGVYYHIIYKGWGQGREREQPQAVLDRMQPAVRELFVNHEHFEYPVEYATTARAVMLAFGVLSVVTVFVLTSLYTSSLTAFLAALLFSLHPAVILSYTEVGVDILAIAFSLLAVVHFVLIERRIWRRSAHPDLFRVLVCVGGGLSLAFAVGSKLNAVVVGLLGALLCLFFIVSFLRHHSSEARESGAAMFVLLVISFLVFVGSNPVNYPNPVAGLWAGYADPQRMLEIQKAVLPAPLQTWGERFQAIAELTALHWALFGLIVAAFMVQVIAAGRGGRPLPVIALWWLIALAAVTAWLPFARPRYAVPVIAPGVILVAGAGERLFAWLRRRRSTALPANSSPTPL